MFKNDKYDEKTDTTYWITSEQDIDPSPYITKKNIDFLIKHYNIKPENYNRRNLIITKCKHCQQVIISHKIREFCSQYCLRENIKTRDNNHQMILKFEREYGIKLDECSYKFIDNNTLQYKPRPWRNRQTYTITVDELLNIYKEQDKRTIYGTMMNKFYKIYNLTKEDWDDTQIDELIKDIFDWLSENEDHVTIIEYFRKHLINPLVLKHLRETSTQFDEFFKEMELYSESIITNKALKGEFNGNFAQGYLKSRYPHWEEKGNNLGINQLPVIINLPISKEEKPKLLGEIDGNNDKINLIEGKNLEQKDDLGF